MDACEGCGYDANGDRRNLHKHKKRCPQRALEMLRRENSELRTERSAAMAEVESRIQAQLDGMRSAFEVQLQQMQATLNALVPAQASATTIHNHNHVAIQINLCAFEDTPRPPRKKVKHLFEHPASSVPDYFALKHCADPSTRVTRE